MRGNRICAVCGAAAVGRLYPASPAFRRKVYRCTDLSPRLPSDLLRCRACGLLRLAEFPPPEETDRPYLEMEDPEYLDDAREREATFDRYLDVIERERPPGRLLDVGCHAGLLLGRARRRGWRVQGLEPSRWGVAQARAGGIEDVRQGTVDSVDFPGASFDVVTFLDVIEHLRDPAAALRRIAGWLKPSGLLLMGTPDGDSLWRRILGPKWWCIREAHLFYFSRRSLVLLLRSAGLAPVRFMTQGRYLAPGRLARLFGDFCAGPVPERSAGYRAGLAGGRPSGSPRRGSGPMLWVDPGDQILSLARRPERSAPQESMS